MKAMIAMGVCLAAVAAHAETLAPKGSRATLRVEYVYAHEGRYVSSSKDQKSDWRAHRSVTLVAQYVAEAPQPFGAMHSGDVQQQKQIAGLQSQAVATQQKMQPTMSDMMAISQQCEASSQGANGKQDEGKFNSCVEAAVMGYSMKPGQLAAGQAAGRDVQQMAQTMSGTRFQMWKLASQEGTFAIDELYTRQVYEMTCTEARPCKRTQTRRGGGAVPAPAGGRSIAGASFLEVDAQNRDMVLTLPVPLAPLGYRETVVSNIPGEKSGEQDAVLAMPWLLEASKKTTVAIPADLRTVSGSRTITLPGAREEGGTVKVTWTFTRS